MRLCRLTYGPVRLNDSPDVDFCGYTIPHPSEPKMHVRLQTRQGEHRMTLSLLWREYCFQNADYCASTTPTNW